MPYKHLAILGAGVVGKVTAHILSDYELTIIDTDPEVNLGDVSSFLYSPVYASKLPDDIKFDAYVICLPTPLTNRTLDMSIIEEYLKQLPEDAHVIYRSTVTIGYFKSVAITYPNMKFTYIPEFLREVSAFEDMKESKRCVYAGYLGVGGVVDYFTRFGEIRPMYLTLEEAEIVKLANNSYLAMRLAFFGEINDYCNGHGISPKRVIDAICEDPRIGNHYNRPPFRIAGKCLPKDLVTLATQTKSFLLTAVTHFIRK